MPPSISNKSSIKCLHSHLCAPLLPLMSHLTTTPQASLSPSHPISRPSRLLGETLGREGMEGKDRSLPSLSTGRHSPTILLSSRRRRRLTNRLPPSQVALPTDMHSQPRMIMHKMVSTYSKVTTTILTTIRNNRIYRTPE